jgi:hypothetical protein
LGDVSNRGCDQEYQCFRCDFQLLQEVEAVSAQKLLDKGYQLLDVRYEEEREIISIPNSINIPLVV